jgi:LCP family protein required for cell wall assembly
MSSRQKKPAKKRRTLRTVLLSVLGVLLACLAVAFIYVETKISAMNQKIDVGNFTLPPETEEPASTGLPETQTNDISKIQDILDQTANPDEIYSNPKVINILLLGLDTRNPKQFSGSRTDSMIIVTLDTMNKEIKLTSIMRDTLVSIPGHDLNRINTVFAFNGPDAAVQTVQQYFKIKIDYYAVVNFWAVANIIDSVDGVNVTVKSSEVENLNANLDEINKYSNGGTSPHIRSGAQELDGRQAVAYMRIRHVGEADFQRTERQRNVIQAIINKDFSLTKILSIANDLPNNVRTNAGLTDLTSLANTAFGLKGAPVKQLRLPIEGSYKISRYKKMSILIVDFDKNAEALKKFIEEK